MAFPLRCVRDPQQASGELERLTQRTTTSQQRDVRDRVDTILRDVRERGDHAVRELTQRFDGFDPTPLRVPESTLQQAWDDLPDNLRDALDLAHRRINEFHQRQRPADIHMEGAHGEQLGRRWRPVHRAGLYVPGGRAAYPSTVLMNAVPARVAGVEEIVICSPAGADGQVNPVVLAAAHLAGVRTVLRIGGAQAVAAMAYGTESVAKVDVISGPGNIYVTLAKQAVYGQVGIDSLAGPSEVLVIADHSAKANQVASDLLAQAEHDPLASAVLITTSPELADAIGEEIALQLEGHPRREICEASLKDWGWWWSVKTSRPAQAERQLRSRTPGTVGGAAGAPGGTDPACWSHLPWAVVTGGGWRLPGRPQPHPSHLCSSAIQRCPQRGNFHATHLADRLQPRGTRGNRLSSVRAGWQRRAAQPC